MKTKGDDIDHSNLNADNLASTAIIANEMKSSGNEIISFVNECNLQKWINKEEKFGEKSHVSSNLAKGSPIYIANHSLSNTDYGLAVKLFPKYNGPYLIEKKMGKNKYVVRNERGEIKAANISHFKQ